MNWLKNNSKVTLYSSILISSFLLAASLFAEEEKTQKRQYEKLKVFSEILSLIESNYVEPTENDSMIEGIQVICLRRPINKCRLKQRGNLVDWE